VPITRQKSPVFSIVSLPTDSVIVDHAVVNTNFILIVSEINAKGCDLVDLMTYELT
jgi:hypothetical protein